VVISAVPRLLSYDFSLPYVDHPDEPNYYLAGLEWRGLYDNYGYYDAVPPGYIALHTVLQPLLERLGLNGLAATTQVMRLIAVTVNLATLVVIALTARRAAGTLAGLIAGAIWGTSPLVLENGVYALPDPFVYLLVALALWLAAESLLNPKRQHWCIWSLAAGLLAVVFKYPALPALLPGVIAALFILGHNRRRGLRYLTVQVGMTLGIGLWLVFGYGIDFNNLQREGALVAESGLSNVLDPNRVINNLYYVVAPLQPAAWTLVLVLGAAASMVAARRGLPLINLRIAFLSLLIVATIPLLASAFSLVTSIEIRYVLPATTAACVLIGMAVGQIVSIIPSQYARIGQGLLAALLLVMFIPQFMASWQLVQEREPPDRRVALRQWVDTNLEPGTILVTQENHKTFNPFWGGIPYRHWVDWWMMDYIMEHSPQEWREETGISYAVIPLSHWQQMQAMEAGRDYLAQMLHLRDFTTPGQRGPEMIVYRLWRMDVETQVQFGDDILLIGYDQSAGDVQAGEGVTFRFYWQATAQPDDNYSLFIHLTPLDAYTVLAQADGSPAAPERPTLTWNDPGETLISPAYTLTVPPDLAAGEYRVLVGLYNYTTGQRLPVRDAGGNALGDALELTQLTVEATRS
jgi:4-amino-4-deoxy-L-arabinose transferase-like glycosyltransferase